MSTTERELELLQHALGLDRHGRGSEYRNRFVTGPGGSDFELCRALTERGLMEDKGSHPLCGGGHLFYVTETGRAFVHENSPPAPKMTRSQRRYMEFLNADSGLTFHEWLTR